MSRSTADTSTEAGGTDPRPGAPAHGPAPALTGHGDAGGLLGDASHEPSLGTPLVSGADDPAGDAGARDGRRSMTAQAGFIAAAKAFAFALNVALPLLLVRRLSQHDFGIYKQIFLVVNTALNMLPLGFGMSAFYFLPREGQRREAIVLNLLLFHLLVAGVACTALVLYPGLLSTLFRAPEVAARAPWVGVVILLWVGSYFLETVVVANGEIGLGSVLVIGVQWTRTALMLTAALTVGSIDALVVAAMIQGAIQLLVVLIYLRSRFGAYWRAFDWSVVRLQLAYAIPLGVAAVLQQLQIDLPHYFVSGRFGASDYAIYAVGCFELPLFGILCSAVAAVVIPRVSYLQSVANRDEIVELTAEMARKMALVVFPAYVLFLAVAHDFIRLLFTPTYLPSAAIFMVYLTFVPLMVVDTACDPVMRAYAEHRYFFLSVRLVVVAGLALTLGLVGGGLGLIQTVAMVVVFGIVERAVVLARVTRVLRLGRRDLGRFAALGRIACAAGFAGATAVAVRAVARPQHALTALAVYGLVFGAVYVLALFLLRVPTDHERAAVRRTAAAWRRAPTRPAEHPVA
jgi:O-antigen/teichoic acid export membrane protein